MKKTFLILFIFIASVLLFSVAHSYTAPPYVQCSICNSEMNATITNDSGYINTGDHYYHSREWDWYFTCSNNSCTFTRTIHDSESNISHYFTDENVTTNYSTYTSMQHKKNTITKRTCYGCGYSYNSTNTEYQSHVAASPSSETCTGTRHTYYATCTQCGATYVYRSAACDGVNHPPFHVNKQKPVVVTE